MLRIWFIILTKEIYLDKLQITFTILFLFFLIGGTERELFVYLYYTAANSVEIL